MKDLLKMYSFESVHNTPDETALADWICKWLTTHQIEYVREGNNIYNLKDINKPILSAHLDQVRTNGRAVHFFLSKDRHIRGYNKDWQQTSLGGDDKNGIWIILKLLEEGLKFNFIISEGEEVGCVGIKALEPKLKELIHPTQYCIVLDRRGTKDVLKGGGGDTYCSTLAQDLVNYMGVMSVTTGSVSDTAHICQHCESVNMSVAYEAPHTEREHTDFTALSFIKDMVKEIIENFVHYSTAPSVYAKKSYAKEFNYEKYYNSIYG